MKASKLLFTVVTLFGMLGAVSVFATQQEEGEPRVEKIDIDTTTESGDTAVKCPPFC